MNDDEKRIPTNIRALLLLEALADAGRPLTPTELNEEFGLPKPTIHRLCNMLEAQGFLIRDLDGNRLHPAPRLRRLAAGVLSTTRLTVARHKVLEYVSKETGETCNLVLPEGAGMIYLDRVDTHWPLRFQLPIGTHVPFHCTASGKMFLSTLPDRELKQMLAVSELSAESPNTITDPDALMSELQAIRVRGYSTDNEEFMAGMGAVAVPIRDQSGQFLAALAVHAPLQRMSLETAETIHVKTLETGARRLEAMLFADAN